MTALYENDNEQIELTTQELKELIGEWVISDDDLKIGDNCIINDTTGEFLSWGEYY